MLDALEDTGQAEETVVIFTADHGEGRGRHLHVGKGTPYEEAVKVPLVFSCPDRIASGLVDRTHLVSGIDVMDSVCDLAGIQPPKTTGRSLRPLLESRQVAWRESLGVEYQISGRMLRTPQFKYVRYQDDPVEQLFDMSADPWETKNLYQDSKHAGVLQDHRRLLAQWEARMEPVEPTTDMSLRPKAGANNGERPHEHSMHTGTGNLCQTVRGGLPRPHSSCATSGLGTGAISRNRAGRDRSPGRAKS